MTESKRPLKVFPSASLSASLCRASADKPKVRELYRTPCPEPVEGLKRRGVQPWLDGDDLKSVGSVWIAT